MFVCGAGQFGRVFCASLVRPGNKVQEQVAVKTMKCKLSSLFLTLHSHILNYCITNSSIVSCLVYDLYTLYVI